MYASSERFSDQHLAPPIDVPEMLVLDFDRMLSDVSASTDRLQQTAAAYGIQADELNRNMAAQYSRNDGGSYEPLSFIRQQLAQRGISPDGYRNFQHDYIQADTPDLLYADAHRLLDRINQAGIPHLIMTFGVSADWQRMKLAATHYPAGCIITNTADKGAYLSALQHPVSGLFELTATPATDDAKHPLLYRAQRLTFIDDKAQAFANLPQTDRFRGFWLQRGTLLDTQQGVVPANVHTINTLDQLSITEQTVYSRPAVRPGNDTDQQRYSHEHAQRFMPHIPGAIAVRSALLDQGPLREFSLPAAS